MFSVSNNCNERLKIITKTREMHTSQDRILTTHVGSLPRSKAVTDLVFAKERNEAVDDEIFNLTMHAAVDAVVLRQIKSGVDIVSDGEMSSKKILVTSTETA